MKLKEIDLMERKILCGTYIHEVLWLDAAFRTYRHYDLKYTGEYATAQISQPDFRPTAQTQQPTVCLDLPTGTGTVSSNESGSE